MIWVYYVCFLSLHLVSPAEPPEPLSDLVVDSEPPPPRPPSQLSPPYAPYVPVFPPGLPVVLEYSQTGPTDPVEESPREPPGDVLPSPKEPPLLPDFFPEPPPLLPGTRPVSSAGRWLHTAVVTMGQLVIYGGISSYTDVLFNDMWLYNDVDSQWRQLQASYIPPLPRPLFQPTNASRFRPDSVPPPPPLRDAPNVLPSKPPVPDSFKLQFQTPPPPKITAVEPIPEMPPKNQLASTGRRLLGRGPDRKLLSQNSLNPAEEQPQHEFFKLLQQQESHRDEPLQIPPILSGSRQTSQSNFLQSGEKVSSPRPEMWGNYFPSNLRAPWVMDDLWVYNLNTSLWSMILPSNSTALPPPRWLHAAVEYQGKMFVIGGVSFANVLLSDVWIFDVTKATWLEVITAPKLPLLPVQGHSAVVWMDKVYVFGGIGYGSEPFNDVWSLPLMGKNWKYDSGFDKRKLVQPRWLHSAVAYEAKMWVFGGVNKNAQPLNDLLCYTLPNGPWKVILQLEPPFPRMLHRAVEIDGRMIVYGGMANNIPLDDMWILDLKPPPRPAPTAKGTPSEAPTPALPPTQTKPMIWKEELGMIGYPFARAGHSMCLINLGKTKPKKAKANKMDEERRERLKASAKRNPVSDLGMERVEYPEPSIPLGRAANRFRKSFNYSRVFILFGGASSS